MNSCPPACQRLFLVSPDIEIVAARNANRVGAFFMPTCFVGHSRIPRGQKNEVVLARPCAPDTHTSLYFAHPTFLMVVCELIGAVDNTVVYH